MTPFMHIHPRKSPTWWQLQKAKWSVNRMLAKMRNDDSNFGEYRE